LTKFPQNLDTASDDEEEDLMTLSNLESKLLLHDPTFTYEDTFEGQSQKLSALMNAFRPRYKEGDSRGLNRLHLNVERWRVPEAWWQPGIAGVDAAGLGELVESVLKTFKEEERRAMVQVRSTHP
jgi:actin-related protein 5